MQIGHLQIYESGAVKLRLGDVVLDVTRGAADGCVFTACTSSLAIPS